MTEGTTQAPSPTGFAAPLPPEEQARANFYALIARLFYAPPDRELLAALVSADGIVTEGADSSLATAWRELMLAAAATDPDAASEEYDRVFVGTGKAPVTLYTSAYTVKSAVANPLVEIRDFLLARDLARRESASEPEDHISALCEVMRHLVAEQQTTAEDQRALFMRFLWPAAPALCDAVINQEPHGFYRHVARFAKNFFALEHTAFEMA